MANTVLQAEATHHAAPRGSKTARAKEVVESETYEAPRQLKTPPPGARLGVLDPAPPGVEAVTVGHVAAGAPLLAVPTLRDHNDVNHSDPRLARQSQKENGNGT